MTQKQLTYVLDWLLMYGIIDTKQYVKLLNESLPFLE
jgi:hypothetical protein